MPAKPPHYALYCTVLYCVEAQKVIRTVDIPDTEQRAIVNDST